MSLFDQLRELGLPLGRYAVFGSGPLVVRGIIPLANDIDVIVTQDVWDSLSEIGNVERLLEYDVHIVSMANGALTFGTQWGIGHFEIDALIKTADIIDGLPFVRIEHVAHYKRLRATAKDLKHLAALADWSANEV